MIQKCRDEFSIPLKAAVLTASNVSSEPDQQHEDESGLLLRNLLETLPAEVVAYRVVREDTKALARTLIHLSDLLSCDLILTTGGTGLSPGDCMPDATREVIEKEIQGIAQTLRDQNLKRTPDAMLSRATAGIRHKTLIINLPAGPSEVQEAFETLRPVLLHAVDLIRGEILPQTKSFPLP